MRRDYSTFQLPLQLAQPVLCENPGRAQSPYTISCIRALSKQKSTNNQDRGTRLISAGALTDPINKTNVSLFFKALF